MSQLGTFAEFHDYFQDIATRLADVTAFKFGDRDMIQCSARSDLQDRTLWVERYDPVRILDNKSDNHTGLINSSLVLLAKDPKKWDDQRSLYEELEAIIKQIIYQIYVDWQSGNLQVDLGNGYSYGWVETKLGATEMLGCRLDFTFMRPERLGHDPTKWNS